MAAGSVVANAGSGGHSFASDLIGGVDFPKSKLTWGVDGVAVDANATNPLPITQTPTTAGGVTDYHAVAAGSNNAAVIKASAGQVYGIQGFNNAAYPVYVKLYNKATTPAPASDAVIRSIGIQAGTAFFSQIPNGLPFATGIAVAIVKGISDTDNTSVVASDCVVDIDYK